MNADDPIQFVDVSEPERWEAPIDACPFCPPGTPEPIMASTGHGSPWFVMCLTCSAMGPRDESHYRAAAAWSVVSDAVWE